MQHFSIHNDLISEHFYEILLSNILLVILNFNPQKRQEFISFVESYKFMNKSNGRITQYQGMIITYISM